MRRIHAIVIASQLALAVAALPTPRAAAQGDEPATNFFHQRDVLVEDFRVGRNMIGPVTRIVARRLTAKFANNDNPFPLEVSDVSFKPTGGELLGGQDVFQLGVSWGGSSAYEKDSEKLWEAARREMETALRKLQETVHNNQRADRELEMQRLQNIRESSLRELENIIANLDAQERDAIGSPESSRAELAATAAQLRKLQLDQIGVEARRKAIEKRIDELRQESQDKAANDPVIAELQKIVNIREKQLGRLQELNDQGTVTDGELQAAEAEFAGARIELLKARRDAADRVSGATLQELNNELSTLIVRAAELEEQINAVTTLVDELAKRASSRAWAELEALNHRLLLVRRSLDQADGELLNLEGNPLPNIKPITIRPLEEALLGEGKEDGAD